MKLDLMHNCFTLSSCDLLDMFLFLFWCFVRICHHGCTHLTWPSDVEDCGREIDLTPALALQTHLICKCYWCTHCSLLWISDTLFNMFRCSFHRKKSRSTPSPRPCCWIVLYLYRWIEIACIMYRSSECTRKQIFIIRIQQVVELL